MSRTFKDRKEEKAMRMNREASVQDANTARRSKTDLRRTLIRSFARSAVQHGVRRGIFILPRM